MRPPIHEERWFIQPMQTPAWAEESCRTVLAGKPIGANRLVAVFDTAEEAADVVRKHNARLDEKGSAEAAISMPSQDHEQSGEKPMTEDQEYIAGSLPATPAAPPSEQPWSDDILFFFLGHRLPEPLFESQLPSDHPLFVQRTIEVLKRQRDKDGLLVGTYEVIETYSVIELRRG